MKRMKRRKNPMKARGFTLVELLVCMGVIVLLCSLLLPQMSSLSDRGRNISCLSQLRQIGGALQSYAAENNQTGPYDAREAGNTSIALWKYNNQKVLFGMLMPYLDAAGAAKTPKILICPGASQAFREMLAASGDNTSYWMNPEVTSNPTAVNSLLALRGSRVAIMDSCTWWQPGIFGPDYDNHSGKGFNVFRLNGSASWVPIAKSKGLGAWDWSQLDKL